MNDSQLDEGKSEVASPAEIRRMTQSLFRGDESAIRKRKQKDGRPKDQNADSGSEFGIRFQAVPNSDIGKVVTLPETGLGTLQALMRGFYDFLRAHPQLGLKFIEVFERRKLNPGFPEHIGGESALLNTIESMLLSVPEENQIKKVQFDIARSDNKSISAESKAELEAYFAQCVQILTTLSFSRLNFLVRVVRNISRERKEFHVFIAALHLNYIESGDVTPF